MKSEIYERGFLFVTLTFAISLGILHIEFPPVHANVLFVVQRILSVADVVELNVRETSGFLGVVVKWNVYVLHWAILREDTSQILRPGRGRNINIKYCSGSRVGDSGSFLQISSYNFLIIFAWSEI